MFATPSDRDEIERCQQRPHDASRRGNRVQAARRRAHRGDGPRLQPHGEGRDRAQEHAGDQEQDQAGDQRPEARAHVAIRDAAIQSRIDERQQRDDDTGNGDQRGQDREARPAVRRDPAQPVPQAQRSQHDADQAPPHEDGVTEVRGEHPAADDLEGHQDGPAHEDDRVQQPRVPRRPVARSIGRLVLTGVGSVFCHGARILSSVKWMTVRSGRDRDTGFPGTGGPGPWPARPSQPSAPPGTCARPPVGRPGDRRSFPTSSRPRR